MEEKMMTGQVTAHIEELQRDGVCFYCGSYEESLAIHETKVHGKDRSRQNEVY